MLGYTWEIANVAWLQFLINAQFPLLYIHIILCPKRVVTVVCKNTIILGRLTLEHSCHGHDNATCSHTLINDHHCPILLLNTSFYTQTIKFNLSCVTQPFHILIVQPVVHLYHSSDQKSGHLLGHAGYTTRKRRYDLSQGAVVHHRCPSLCDWY